MAYWKKLWYHDEWRAERQTLLFLAFGLFLIGVIHFFSERNILRSVAYSNLLERDQELNTKLWEIENHLLAMEKNMHDYLLSENKQYHTQFDQEAQEAKQRINEIEQLLSTEATQPNDALNHLKQQVQLKINYHNTVVNVFVNEGKESAEQYIVEEQSIRLNQNIVNARAALENTAGIDIKKRIQDNQSSNRNNLLLDNLAFLVGLLFLIFALFYLFQTLIKRVKLQENLLNAKKEVEQSAKVKEQFLANMSHEIRTPLQAILGYSDRLNKEKLNPQQTQYTHSIQVASESLLAIVNDILDVSKIESGTINVEAEPFSLANLLGTLERMFQDKAVKKGIYLKFHANPAIPDTLLGDALRLTQILINLIGNAVKFTEQGGVDLMINIKDQSAQNIKLQFLVKDSGIGIPKDKLGSIFNRFEQIDAQMSRKYGGSGLGLYIASQLAEMQDGKIKVNSEFGKGSEFLLELPFQITDASIPSNVPNQTASNLAGIKLLLVEDNLMNQRIVGHFLTDRGIDYDLAEDGKIAIQRLEQQTYDLVLMDIQMPEMDGYTATEYIRKNLSSKIPIIAMTAHALVEEKEKALSYGMDDYISKPIQEETLFQLIARFIPVPDSNPTVHIDHHFLMNTAKGNTTYLQQILDTFQEQAPLEMGQLEEALHKGDFVKVSQIAHSLKSTVGYVGLGDSLNPTLEIIEKETKDNPDPNKLTPLVKSLKTKLQEAILLLQKKA